jgi:hypothetical protein
VAPDADTIVKIVSCCAEKSSNREAGTVLHAGDADAATAGVRAAARATLEQQEMNDRRVFIFSNI